MSNFSGATKRGAVIVPACNEATVIRRTLEPLSHAALQDFFELIVVCNGCTDETAEVASSIPGVRVLDLPFGSKPAALNAGDDAATLWPRIYLDADIQVTSNTVLSLLDHLRSESAVAGTSVCAYDTGRASVFVRSYFRARARLRDETRAIWGAGVYGINEAGHQRFGRFPDLTADDLFVDLQFKENEKLIVDGDPAVVTAPADLKSLLGTRKRAHRGNVQIRREQRRPMDSLKTAGKVITTVSDVGSAIDALTFFAIGVARRVSRKKSTGWYQDRTSRY